MNVLMHLKRGQTSCDFYRSLLPARFMKPQLLDNGINLILDYSYDKYPHPQLDAVIIQRHVDSHSLTGLMARQVQGKPCKIAYDIDDDLLRAPDWSTFKPTQHMKEEIIACRTIADFTWCSTPPLANSMRWRTARNKETIVLPNLLDMRTWDGGRPNPAADGQIRICWAGSNTHDGDLRLIEPAMEIIFKKYKHVDFLFFGDPPEHWLESWFERIIQVEWMPLNLYARELMNLKPHIFLCPLTSDQFNYSKSSIKFSEATLAGAAVIASPVPPYRIEKMEAMRYAKTTEEWVEQISILVEDHDARRTQQEIAHDRVDRFWTWQKSPYTRIWFDAMMQLVGLNDCVPEQKPEDKPESNVGVMDALKKMKGK